MHSTRATDERHMARAMQLAARGGGWVNPNPQVGCVLVRNGRVIGEGWHARYGGLHAEREALRACREAGESPQGATAYVTLEPCCHTGKQPPCCDALIEAGVARVVTGSADPNPLVAGGGIQRLRAAGIQVDEGVLRAECDALNRPFFHFIATGRTFVIAKYAMTLDGKAATRTGASKWVTGEDARRRVHADRARYAAVMAGVGTVIADDPLLTARGVGADAHQPVRIVCDTHLRTPLGSQLVVTAREAPVIIATGPVDQAAIASYEDAGCAVMQVPLASDGRISLPALMQMLGQRGISSVIAEGGPALLGACFDAGCIDSVQVYIAPKLFGGADAPSPVGGLGVAVPSDALRLSDPVITPLGCDILIEGRVAASEASAQRQEDACSRAS